MGFLAVLQSPKMTGLQPMDRSTWPTKLASEVPSDCDIYGLRMEIPTDRRTRNTEPWSHRFENRNTYSHSHDPFQTTGPELQAN